MLTLQPLHVYGNVADLYITIIITRLHMQTSMSRAGRKKVKLKLPALALYSSFAFGFVFYLLQCRREKKKVCLTFVLLYISFQFELKKRIEKGAAKWPVASIFRQSFIIKSATFDLLSFPLFPAGYLCLGGIVLI